MEMPNPIHANVAQDFALIGASFLNTKYMIQPAIGTKSERMFNPVDGSSISVVYNSLLGCIGMTALPQ